MNSSIAKNIYMYNGVPINPWKKCSVSLVIRVIQTKATKKYHYAPTTMAEIKKIDSPKCWQRCGATGTTIHSCRTTKMVQSLWRTLWQFLIKKKYNIHSQWCSNWIPSYLPKEMKMCVPTKICPWMFSQKLSNNSWVDKQIKVWYLYNRMLCGNDNNWTHVTTLLTLK